MIQIWRVLKPELSDAKLAYGLIFLSMCLRCYRCQKATWR